jgi:hypothetical protein
MAGRRGRSYSARAFAVSLGWILALLVGYWLIADWDAVPRLFVSLLPLTG